MSSQLTNYRIVPGKSETWADDDGLARIRFMEGSEIEESDMELIIALALETFDPQDPFFVLVDLRNMQSISDGARKFASTKELEKYYKALALLVNSTATRLIANFFIQFHKPPHPTRIFSNEKDAVEWLKELRALQ